jgi:hypothetical protein
MAMVFAAAVFTAAADADTIFPPGTGEFTVTATVNGTTYTYPNGGPGPSIPGVEDGDTVAIQIQDAAGGPTVNFARLRARQCAGNRGVSNNTEFTPSVTNRCSSVTLGGGTPGAFVDSGPVAPGTTALSLNYTIGAGSAPDVVEPIFGDTIPGFDCGPGAPCKIVVNAEVTTGTGSSNYLSFPITFFEEPPTGGVTLLDCDRVAGTAGIKPTATDAQAPNTAITTKGPLTAGTDPFKPQPTMRDCTGLLATAGDGGTPDDVGNLAKVTGKVVGVSDCSVVPTPSPANRFDPVDGKLTLTFTELDPNSRPWSSQPYVRLEAGAGVDEVVIANGIVIKGPGVGSTVEGSLVFNPYDSKTKSTSWPGEPATPKPAVRPNQAFIDGNSVIQPGAGSAAIATECAAGLLPIATVFFGTDGTGPTGGVVDSSIKFTLPG